MQNQNQTNETLLNGIKAVAAASNTPFKTAFKVTLGIAAAQLVVAVVVFGGFATVLGTVAYILSR